MTELKRCPSCGETKPLDAEHFYRNRATKSGLSVYCKPCMNEKFKAVRPAWAARSRAKVEAGLVTEKRCSCCGRVLPVSEFFRHSSNVYGITARCKGCLGKAQKERNALLRAEGRPYRRDKRQAKKLAIMQHYCGSETPFCECCGTTYLPHLTIDHINGGGKQHRKEVSTAHFYDWIVNNGYPEGYRVLCMNCNTAMYREPGGCHCRTTVIIITA